MDYPRNVTVKIDGIAASAASVIAMAGTRVLVSPVSMMMIHNPMTVAMWRSWIVTMTTLIIRRTGFIRKICQSRSERMWAFAVVPSRNNGKVKDGKAARPRFHVYFPHDPITDSETCAALKRAIQQKFPFFDSHALELPGSSLATPQRKYCGMKARSPSTVWKKPSLEEWLFRSDV